MSNKITLVGNVVSDFSYSHELYGEKFYNVTLSVERASGKADLLPLLVSERLLDGVEYHRIGVTGEIRTHNQHDADKTRIKIYVFVDDIKLLGVSDDINDAFLDGYICKPPTYRLTPNGREISDLILAVNRGYNKSDYIPCICWGRTAHYAKSLNVGDQIRVAGRLQSREYVKNENTKTAYELSVNLLEIC